MASVAMYASIGSNELDSKLEKISLKLLQKSLYNSHKPHNHIHHSNNYHHHNHLHSSRAAQFFFNSQSKLTSSISTAANKAKAKKMVRFADSLGYELVTVRLVSASFDPYSFCQSEESDSDDFNSDTPSTDNSSDEVDTSTYQFSSSSKTTNNSDPNTFIYDNLNFTWKCLFEQPGISPDFYARIRQNKVLLEAIYSNHFKLNGFIRVQNLTYHKRVFIRYTLNNWKTYTDSECSYLMNGTSDQNQTDRFKFSIVLDKTGLINTIDENIRSSSNAPVLKLEFAVCYELKTDETIDSTTEQVYWDNNNSKNYQYDCFFKILSPNKI